MATKAFPHAAVLLLVTVPYLGNYVQAQVSASAPQNPLETCIARCNEDPASQKECQCGNPQIEIRCPDHFATMGRTAFVDRVGRMYRSRDINAYNAYDVCNLNYTPPKILDGLKVCGNAIVGAYYGPMFHRAQIENPILTLEIYECIAERSLDMTPMEREQLRAYEECVQAIQPVCKC